MLTENELKFLKNIQEKLLFSGLEDSLIFVFKEKDINISDIEKIYFDEKKEELFIKFRNNKNIKINSKIIKLLKKVFNIKEIKKFYITDIKNFNNNGVWLESKI